MGILSPRPPSVVASPAPGHAPGRPELFQDPPSGYRWVAVTPFVARLVSTAPTSIYYPTRPAPEPRPTFVDRFEVSPEAEAEWSGFSLGLRGEPAAGNAEYTPAEREAFARGHAAGFAEYQAEVDREYYADLDRINEVFADPTDGVEPAELVEAIGAVEMRKAVAR